MIHGKKSSLAGAGVALMRRMFVIDIENVVGGARNVTFEGAMWARRILEAEMGMMAEEHAVVAVSASQALIPAAAAFRGKSLRVRFGESGADHALIDAIDVRHTATRYADVVIASGDGIFADLAARLAGAGVRVTAVGHEHGVSAALRLATHHVHYLSHSFASAEEVA